jgi:glutathione synthase/RimK-type ligase-like ATP-grasp enzyme
LDEEEKSKYDGVEDYKQEKWSLVQRMEKEAGLDFLSDPHLMEYIEHKGDAKELYSMMDVRTAESYDILDAVEKLRNGEPVIAKPVDKNQGEGVELLYPQETEQSAWNMLTGYLERESEDLPEALENVEFEEYIDITQEENKEKRMYFVGDKAMIAYKEHPNIDEGFIAQNSHNGGEYTDQHAVMEGPEDLDKLSPSERDIYRAGKQVGGIHAVDYIDQEGGEAVFIEDNGCPGHGTNGPVDVDIPELEKEEIVEQMNSHHKRMLN